MRITTYTTKLDENLHNVLVKEKSRNYSESNFNNPENIVNMLNELYQLNDKAEEYLYMIAFNTKLYPLGVFEISHGTVNQSICNPRDIFIKALLCGATGIIMAHNHPSKDTNPSKDDIYTCNKVCEVGNLIGIEVWDNIIIGNDFFSFRKHNLI